MQNNNPHNPQNPFQPGPSSQDHQTHPSPPPFEQISGNPITQLYLQFLNPQKAPFEETVKSGLREVAGLVLQNIGVRIRKG